MNADYPQSCFIAASFPNASYKMVTRFCAGSGAIDSRANNNSLRSMPHIVVHIVAHNKI